MNGCDLKNGDEDDDIIIIEPNNDNDKKKNGQLDNFIIKCLLLFSSI